MEQRSLVRFAAGASDAILDDAQKMTGQHEEFRRTGWIIEADFAMATGIFERADGARKKRGNAFLLRFWNCLIREAAIAWIESLAHQRRTIIGWLIVSHSANGDLDPLECLKHSGVEFSAHIERPCFFVHNRMQAIWPEMRLGQKEAKQLFGVDLLASTRDKELERVAIIDRRY
jgi:hypothetical protein